MMGKQARAARRYRKLEIELGGCQAKLANMEKMCDVMGGSSAIERESLSRTAERIGQIKAEMAQLRDILYPGSQEHYDNQQRQKQEENK